MLNFLTAEIGMDYLINHAKEKLQNKYAVVQAVLSLIPLSFFPQYF